MEEDGMMAQVVESAVHSVSAQRRPLHRTPARFGRVTRGGGGRDRQKPPNHESQANVSALSPVHHSKLLKGPKLELGHSNDPDLAPVGCSEKTPAFLNWVHYPGS
ncbi:hypothetical protein E4U27_006272 [Claviceps purpurea]|nr:hypothetical protein E4U27_006272 [Claviceps purpurea]